jgi:hypothetical protein
MTQWPCHPSQPHKQLLVGWIMGGTTIPVSTHAYEQLRIGCIVGAAWLQCQVHGDKVDETAPQHLHPPPLRVLARRVDQMLTAHHHLHMLGAHDITVVLVPWSLIIFIIIS